MITKIPWDCAGVCRFSGTFLLRISGEVLRGFFGGNYGYHGNIMNGHESKGLLQSLK